MGFNSRRSKNLLDFSVLFGKESICLSIKPKTCISAVFEDLPIKNSIDSLFGRGRYAIILSLEASEVFI